MKRRKLSYVIREGEDGWFVARCPQLRGCRSQGKATETQNADGAGARPTSAIAAGGALQ